MNDERLQRLEAVIEDQLRSSRTLQETIEGLLPLLLKNGGGASTNRTTVTQTDRTPMWVCVVIVVALAAAQWGRDDSTREDITRLQADVRELREVDADLRSTDNAVRAYINTGILKPKTEANKGTGQ